MDAAKVPADGVHAQCSVCARVFRVERPEAGAPAWKAPEREAWTADEEGDIADTAHELDRGIGWQEALEREVATEIPTVDRYPPEVEEEEAAPEAVEIAPVWMPEEEREPEAPEPVVRPRFGQRDPEERARRLARVLVSDMVAYHPQLYREALAAGTLSESFEDEIRRSWEEYVEQVGQELAESTGFFQQALNEILAQGEEIF